MQEMLASKRYQTVRKLGEAGWAQCIMSMTV